MRSATLIVCALLMPLAVISTAPTAISAHPPTCTMTDSGSASCDFSCGQKNILVIEVTSPGDADDEVSGTASCGGASADCPPSAHNCRGMSEPTSRSADDGSCYGTVEWYDWWSRVEVTCASQSPDTGEVNEKVHLLITNVGVRVTTFSNVDGVLVPTGEGFFSRPG